MLYHASGEHPSPCGLYDSLCTLRVGRSTVMSILPSHATLGTGGWLFLTRQGLSPCKKHQALPGAHVVTLWPYFDAVFMYKRGQSLRTPAPDRPPDGQICYQPFLQSYLGRIYMLYRVLMRVCFYPVNPLLILSEYWGLTFGYPAFCLNAS